MLQLCNTSVILIFGHIKGHSFSTFTDSNISKQNSHWGYIVH